MKVLLVTPVNPVTYQSIPDLGLGYLATYLRKAVLRLSNNLPPVKWAITQKLMAKNQIKSFWPTLPGL